MKQVAALFAGLAAAASLYAGLLTAASPPAVPPPQTISASIEVNDGDTITAPVEGERTLIRYLLIDTPELHHPARPEEELAREAREANIRLASSGRVRIEYDLERIDRYGRLLAYVWVSTPGGDLLLNEELVRRGLALPLAIPPNRKYADRIFSAMSEARNENAGLWGRAERRIFTAAQVWNEAAVLAGCFITVRMTVEKREERGRRLLLREGKLSLAAYRAPETEDLWSLKEGDRVLAAGKLILSRTGCELPIVSSLQVSRDSG